MRKLVAPLLLCCGLAGFAPAEAGTPADSATPGPASPPPAALAPPGRLAVQTCGAAGVTADGLFVRGYALERDGKFREAGEVYEWIGLHCPTSEATALARERLLLISKGVKEYATPASAAPAAVAAPASAAPAAKPGAPDAAPVGRSVCTVKGLYESGSKWCGVVRMADETRYMVEVTKVDLNPPWAIGFEASNCTGRRFIGWFSDNLNVWVPKKCMAEPW